tara:strand:- start:3864 stop:4685 length:822 start_codon:yes stop_codon:yes gene_type:complete
VESTDSIWKNATSTHPLQVSNLSVKRSGSLIIKDVDFSIKQGEFVGLVGPNGSGKTTLILSILGILKPFTGEVKIYGHEVNSKELHGRIAWVSQAAANLPSNIRLTVRELVKLGTLKGLGIDLLIRRSNADEVNEAIDLVGLREYADTSISKLSGGQRQRAVIARALASKAEFILLDEPLVGIDRDSRNALLKFLDGITHNTGTTILMVSHDITAMRRSTHRIIYLEETIQFDGRTEDFPDLNIIAELRGIKPVHDEIHNIDSSDCAVCLEEE